MAFITPEQVISTHARMTYDLATALYNEQQQDETSLVETNAADLIAECDRLGIQSQPDDSERYIDESDAWGVSVG